MDSKTETVSVWTIAGGILLALVVWRALNVWQYNHAVKEANAMIAETMRDMRTSNEMTRRQQEERRQVRVSEVSQRQRDLDEAKALKPDERCIAKQRFRRLRNGWEQIGSC